MMISLTLIYLMSQPAGGAGGGQSNPMITFLPLILVFVVFYFFMIRPQMRKQKEMNTYRSSLKKGDKVVTTGGIYGRVHEVRDNYIMMDAGGDVRLKIDKSALLRDPSAEE